MDSKQLDDRLQGIRHLLSHLHGEITSLEGTYQDVLQVLRRIELINGNDELTGLLKRSPFFRKWREFIVECERLKENTGILLIDVDDFQKITENHGVSTGDEVIKRVSSLLKQYQSPNCFSGRYGGEEFIVAIRGTDSQILGTAEFIRRSAERMHGPVIGRDGEPLEAVEWKCTLSLGMASSLKVGFDATRLLTAADQALMRSKKKGRNQITAA